MSDASYPAVGLQVDFDDFARLDTSIDKSVAAYGKLHDAATKASKTDLSSAAERSMRVQRQAAEAQLMSVNRIMAAQRGMAAAQQQQDAQVLRSRQALANQQSKISRDQERAAEQAVKSEAQLRARSLSDFRKMMADRIAAGRAAANAEDQIAQRTFETRRRLNAQQGSEIARRLANESAEAAKAEREAAANAERSARQREQAASYVQRLKVRYFLDEQRAQERVERASATAAEKSARDQVAAEQRAAKEREKALQYVHNLKLRYFREEQAAQERAARAEAAAEARAAREREAAIARANRAQAQSGYRPGGAIVQPTDPGLFDRTREAMSRLGGVGEGLRNKLHALRVVFFDIRTVVSMFIGGLVVGPIVRFADAMTALEARIGFFAKSSADVPYLFQAVYETAQRTRAPLEAVATLYTRLAPLADQLGKSQRELLKVTETVQKGIAIGGATGAEATSSAQQLAQALASNRLGGDELRSLAENAPILLGAIAKELNMSTGQFIKWAHDGKASAEVVVGALEAAAPRIDALFEKFPVTIGQGVTVVGNAVKKLVGEVNSATQAGQQIGAAFVDFSKFLSSPETIAAVAQGVNALMLAFKALGVAVGVVVDGLPVIIALLAVLAIRAVATSAAVSSLGVAFASAAIMGGRSATIFSVAATTISAGMARVAAAGKAAMAFLGGGWGLAILAVATAFSVYSSNALTAAEATQKFDSATNQAASAMERAAAFLDTYGGNSREVTDAILRLHGAQEEQIAGMDDATAAAEARGVIERALTVDLLNRAAAEQTAAAASLRRNAVLQKAAAFAHDAVAFVSAPNSPVRAAHKVKADEARRAADYNESLAVQLTKDSAATAALSKTISATPIKIAVPDANGSGNGSGGSAEADKKTAAERRAEQLRREADAQNAVIQGNLALAKAYDVSESAALRQIAVTEARERAIKKGADEEAYVARQLNENASEAAANAAKEVFELNRKTKAQEAANNAVRSGAMTSQAAAEQMAISLDLARMQSEADAATGPARDLLITKINEKREAMERANAVDREARALADQAAARDDAEIIEREIELIGKSNRERAIALALLRAEQSVRAQGPMTPAGAETIIQAGVDAGRQVYLVEQVDAYNDSLTLQADLLAQVADRARDVGNGLTDAFGQGAAALSDLLQVMTSYEAKQEAIAVAKADYVRRGGQDAERLAMFDRDAANATLSHYGDMAGAAKNLFDERSRGYRMLMTAEKAFRLFEFAMSAKSVAVKTVETAAKIGLFGAQAQAAAAAGAANMFATMGPAGFAAVAAMVAVLAGLGVALSGGAGSGSVPGATDMADRQAAQGAGSVLGSVSAKSESLTRALELVAANSNKDLEYSNSMLKALQAIESGIGAVAAGLARSLGVGGSLSTDGLNLGASKTSGTGLATVLGGVAGFVMSKILPGWFGTTTTRTLQDQGLQFGSQSLSDILSGGIDGQTYQQVLENTKKKVFGITYSDKNKVSTTTGSLDADFAGQVTGLVGSLRGAVLEGAKMLGVDGAAAVLDSFQVNLGKLSFKDMSGEEIQEALSAIFSKLGDDLAKTAIPELAQLQKVGEGAFETLARVSRNYVVLDTSLTSIGMTFGAVGVASLAAREQLIEMAGGIDQLVESTQFFADNFLTDLERMVPIQKAVTAELARLGLQGVTTKEQFKNLVLGLDLSSKAGAEMYAALIALAPAFAKVVDFTAGGSKAVQSARDDLQKAYEAERSSIQANIDQYKRLADSLKDFRESLTTGSLAANGPARQYALTRQQFLDTAALARTGDRGAMGALPETGKNFLEASKAYSVTLLDYQRDLAKVRTAVEDAEQAALSQVSLGEQQLAALNAQVAGLITINESVLSVTAAIIALQAALAAQAAATLPTQPQAPTTPQPGANDNVVQPPAAQTRTTQDWAAYINANQDVAAEYARLMASEKGRQYLAGAGIDSGAEFGQLHWNNYGQYEPGRNVPTMEVPLTRDAAAPAAASANDNATADVMTQLAERIEDLITGVEQVAVNTGGQLRLNKRWDGDGMPGTRSVTP